MSDREEDRLVIALEANVELQHGAGGARDQRGSAMWVDLTQDSVRAVRLGFVWEVHAREQVPEQATRVFGRKDEVEPRGSGFRGGERVTKFGLCADEVFGHLNRPGQVQATFTPWRMGDVALSKEIRTVCTRM